MTYVYESWMVLLHSTSITDESESACWFFHTVIVHYSGHDCLFTFFEARMNFTFLSLCSICLLAAKCHFIPIPVTHLLSYFKPLKGTTSDDVTSRRNRKCANISVYGLPIVFLSVFMWQNTLLLQIWASQDVTILSKKGLAYDVKDAVPLMLA